MPAARIARPSHSRRARPTVAVSAALAAAALLGSACGADSRNVADTPSGVTAIAPTTDTTGAAGPDLASVKLRLVTAAKVVAPTALVPRPGSTDLYVAEQTGKVRRIEVEATSTDPVFTLADGNVLDMTAATTGGGERGLLGLAFSPEGDRLFVYFTARADGAVTIDRYDMDGTTADPATKVNLLSLPHERPNHNGGALAFGPDGHLYIGIGDGGGGGDPDKNGQRTDTLYGRILRIDVKGGSGDRPYGIPADNPFASGGGAPEVWSYGLRNPWRISFDRETDDLWIADVGQGDVEEIDRVLFADGNGKGANFGWNLMEGTKPYDGGTPPPGHVAPVFEYGHADDNCSVTGGYVYRGKRVPALRGAYVFGDYCKSHVRGLVVGADGAVEHRELGPQVAANTLSSFGEDNDGELYVLSLDGTVSLLAPR